ncbi:MAG: SUMF1/EgtB/PvdO family nonheme iron enzyme, partial [Salibacteraceae bacterium]
YGLYHMAGNVSEWVMDVYRANTAEDETDFRSFRGNKYQKISRDEDGYIAEKDSLGRMIRQDIEIEDAKDRRNYRQADNINYLDGDFETQLSDQVWLGESETENSITNGMYEYGVTSLITDHSRVYKGGSWKDRAYWLHPGTRRYLDENLSNDNIGFRCAMDRMGSPTGLGSR